MGVIKYKIEKTEHEISLPAPLRMKLNPEEEETLAELRKAISVPYRTRDRAHMLKLNAQGKNVPEIARIFSGKHSLTSLLNPIVYIIQITLSCI